MLVPFSLKLGQVDFNVIGLNDFIQGFSIFLILLYDVVDHLCLHRAESFHLAIIFLNFVSERLQGAQIVGVLS